MEYVKKSVATPEQIAAFAQGQGVYIGADGTQIVTRFKKRQSDGTRSNTPKAATAMRYVGKTYHGPSALTSAMDSRETPRLSFDEDEEEAPPQQREVAPPLLEESEDEHDLRLVVEAFNEGSVSLGQLQATTGLGQNRVRVMKARAQFQGLIPKDK